jgi:DNA transformation protein
VADDSIVSFVVEQLSDVPGLGCRAMFGGYGLYCGATFFGIVFDGRLYLKTDASTEPEYLRRGMKPFRPSDRQVLKTYYEVPADVLEDRANLTTWSEEAVRCAAPDARGARSYKGR